MASFLAAPISAQFTTYSLHSIISASFGAIEYIGGLISAILINTD